MSAKADARNFLVVYPKGTGQVDTWNAGAGCGYAMKNKVDDMTVALYAIQGGHHIWPGVRFSRNNVPASDLIWDFFASHPKH
jgi:poly(3-hydroxybutyrate) depolymerase